MPVRPFTVSPACRPARDRTFDELCAWRLPVGTVSVQYARAEVDESVPPQVKGQRGHVTQMTQQVIG